MIGWILKRHVSRLPLRMPQRLKRTPPAAHSHPLKQRQGDIDCQENNVPTCTSRWQPILAKCLFLSGAITGTSTLQIEVTKDQHVELFELLVQVRLQYSNPLFLSELSIHFICKFNFVKKMLLIKNPITFAPSPPKMRIMSSLTYPM